MLTVYKITNKKNGKIYVGATKNPLNQRWVVHKDAAKNTNSERPLCKDMRKYGIKSFTIEVLAECDCELRLKELEKHWMNELNSFIPNGYNKNTVRLPRYFQ